MPLASLDYLQLVSDPLRWRILHELSQSDRRVAELTDRVGKPQNLVSYHLRALRDAGIVTAKTSAADGRDIYYRVEFDLSAALLCRAGAELQRGLRLTVAAPIIEDIPKGMRVLFLCTGNSSRSQMAEAFLRDRTDGRVEACSAGSRPKPVHPKAIAVMAARNIDLSGHTSKPLTRYTRRRFEYVVTLCDRVREICPEFAGAPQTVHWSVADPALLGSTAAFERARDEIDGRVRMLIAQLADNPEVSARGQRHRQRSLSGR